MDMSKIIFPHKQNVLMFFLKMQFSFPRQDQAAKTHFILFYNVNKVLEWLGCLESHNPWSTGTLQCLSTLTQESQIIICPLWNPSTPLRQLDRDQMDWLPCQRCLLSEERNDRNQSLWLTAQSLLFLFFLPSHFVSLIVDLGFGTKVCTDIDVFQLHFSPISPQIYEWTLIIIDFAKKYCSRSEMAKKIPNTSAKAHFRIYLLNLQSIHWQDEW